MKVKELRGWLQNFPLDAEVVLEDDEEEGFSINSIVLFEDEVLIKIEADNDERGRRDDEEVAHTKKTLLMLF